MNITLGARPKKATLPDEDTNDQFDALIKDLQDLVTALKAYQIVVGTDVVGAGDATKYLAGGTVPAWQFVKDSDLSLSNITTNNVSTSKHGFAPILSNDPTQFLDGTGHYSSPGTSLFVSLTHLTGNQFSGLQTTPLTLISGIGSTVIVPIFLSLYVNKPSGAGWTNGNTGWQISYESNKANSLISDGGTVSFALASAGSIQGYALSPGRRNVVSGAPTFSGKAIQLVTLADITSGSGGATSVDVTVVYTTQAALF